MIMGLTKSQFIAMIAPLIVLQLVLMTIALRSLLMTEHPRGLPKWAWAVIICVVNTIGPIVYFIFGREKDV